MITVVGKQGCSRCVMVKNQLTAKHINFDYKSFLDFSQDEQDEIITNATNKGLMNFPIIIKNDEVVSLEEVIA